MFLHTTQKFPITYSTPYSVRSFASNSTRFFLPSDGTSPLYSISPSDQWDSYPTRQFIFAINCTSQEWSPPFRGTTVHYDIPLASLLASLLAIARRRPGNKRTERLQDVNHQKYMHIMNGSHQSHICPHCQCHLGHWFYHNFPKKFRSQPIQFHNGMVVQHIKYCKTHTSVWFFQKRAKAVPLIYPDIVAFFSASS